MSTLFVYFLIINKKRAWQNSVVFNFKEKKFSGGRFKMSKILIKNPLVVATQNENRDELKNTNILIENNLIKSMDYLPEKRREVRQDYRCKRQTGDAGDGELSSSPLPNTDPQCA